MKTIIKKAQAESPNDGTQQFYRVIREHLENMMVAAPDLLNERYEAENGIKVVKQSFSHKNNDYCYWVCQFPMCTTDNGKKKAYYGIETKEDGIWKLLWTEINLNSEDNLSNWSLLFKMRIAAKTDELSSLYAINPFEEAIANAPYHSDIFEQGNIICSIMTDYINRGNNFHKRKEVYLSNGKYRFTIFKLFGTLYTWSEFYANGCIECFQLDAQYDNNISLNLFSNLENTEPLSSAFISQIISTGQ